MSLDVLQGRPEAVAALRRALSLGSCPASASRFEILRAAVWSIAAPGSKAHVSRVLGTALATWRMLAERQTPGEEALRAELREALTILEDAGALVELSGGYWAPATARFVELPDRAGYLLVGGVPSAVLPLEGYEIQFHGPHRYLSTLPQELTPVIPVESLASWARLPSSPLLAWARELFESLERQPYLPASAEAFEFYAPERSKLRVPQFLRWSEGPGDASTTMLARRTRLYGAREYRLVEVRAGRIISVCDTHDVDVRRLMYALDRAAKNPVRARRIGEGLPAEWLFESELPRAEQRTFAAFGTLSIPDDRPFQRRWTFVRHEETALALLHSLGVDLC